MLCSIVKALLLSFILLEVLQGVLANLGTSMLLFNRRTNVRVHWGALLY
jgi:hypothetical protein